MSVFDQYPLEKELTVVAERAGNAVSASVVTAAAKIFMFISIPL